MAEMTGKQLFAKLKDLRNNAGESAYNRLALCAHLLTDRGWVEDPSGGGGDEDKALTRLEGECFADLCGAVTLSQLLDIYAHVPDLATWKVAKFNLRKLWADLSASRRPQARSEPRNGTGQKREQKPLPAPSAFVELTPAMQREVYTRAVKTTETLEQKAHRLEMENAALKDENASLKEEIKRLKKGAADLFRIAN